MFKRNSFLFLFFLAAQHSDYIERIFHASNIVIEFCNKIKIYYNVIMRKLHCPTCAAFTHPLGPRCARLYIYMYTYYISAHMLGHERGKLQILREPVALTRT